MNTSQGADELEVTRVKQIIVELTVYAFPSTSLVGFCIVYVHACISCIHLSWEYLFNYVLFISSLQYACACHSINLL